MTRIALCITLSFFPLFVFAQTCAPLGSPNTSLPPCSDLGAIGDPATAGQYDALTGTPVTAGSIVQMVVSLVNWFSWFIGAVAVVIGLYAGFLFITARGEPAQLQTARKTIVWAIVGIAVAVLAFGIIAITRSIVLLS